MRGYIRKGIYKIDDVLSNVNISPKILDKVNFDGDMIHMNSERYHTFLEKGLKCVKCGIEGKYFAKEKPHHDYPYHFNLYGINENNEEILITKDHIIPKSAGGKNHISNYQTMCVICNEKKADKI